MLHLPLIGGCQCGAVRYEIGETPLMLYVCHCRECQHQSSSAFGMSLRVGSAGFTVRGTTSAWSRPADSGRTVRCFFCPTCGARVFHRPAHDADVLNVRAGTLDDVSWLRPVAHLWASRKQPWVEIPPDVLRYDEQPADYTPVIAAWRAQIAAPLR